MQPTLDTGTHAMAVAAMAWHGPGATARLGERAEERSDPIDDPAGRKQDTVGQWAPGRIPSDRLDYASASRGLYRQVPWPLLAALSAVLSAGELVPVYCRAVDAALSQVGQRIACGPGTRGEPRREAPRIPSLELVKKSLTRSHGAHHLYP
jgi:hypothetical protein